MDAAGHLALADNLLAKVHPASEPVDMIRDRFLTDLALAHAVVALAIEVGVPHSTDSTGAGSGK